MQIHNYLACRFKCSMLPGDRIGKVISGKIDLSHGLQQACIGRIGSLGMSGPVYPCAFAIARFAPIVRERAFKCCTIDCSVYLTALGNGVLFTLFGLQCTKLVGLDVKGVVADERTLLLKVSMRGVEDLCDIHIGHRYPAKDAVIQLPKAALEL